MTNRRRRGAGLLAALVLAAASPCWAGGKGQADLDRATQLKVVATNLSDLTTVIRLCETALEKGLDEENAAFAKTLLAATRIQRGMAVAKEVFGQMPPNPQWRDYRRFALRDLEAGLKIDAAQPEAQLMVGKLNLLPGGDRERARKALDEAVRLSAEEPAIQAQALTLRAGLVEDPEKKLADLNQAIQVAPNEVTTIRARAGLYVDQGKIEEALADLDRALELEPDHAPTRIVRAVVLAELKRFDQALADLDRAHQIQPQSIIPLIQKAKIYGLQEKFSEALDVLNQAHQWEPGNLTVLLLRATVYQELDQSDKALQDLEDVLARQPDHPDARRLRALVLAGEGKFDEAIADLEELQKSQTPDLTDRLRLAMFYAAGEKPQKAVELYTQVLEQDPDNLYALRGRADALLTLGKHAEAIADYEKAINMASDDPGLLNNFSWVLSTSPDDHLRDGKRALELALKACEITNYQQAHILSTLAAAYAELGNFEKAIHWSEKAVETGSQEQQEALRKELETYRAGKPFRERLSAPEPEEEKPEPEGQAETAEKPENHEQKPQKPPPPPKE